MTNIISKLMVISLFVYLGKFTQKSIKNETVNTHIALICDKSAILYSKTYEFVEKVATWDFRGKRGP